MAIFFRVLFLIGAGTNINHSMLDVPDIYIISVCTYQLEILQKFIIGDVAYLTRPLRN